MCRSIIVMGLSVTFSVCGPVPPCRAADSPPPTTSQPTTQPAGRPATAPAPVDEQRLRALVRQLAAEDARDRERAEAELEALGEAAEPNLRGLTADPATDPEVLSRIEAVLRRAAERRRLGPTPVTLHLKGASPRRAFADLARAGGIELAPASLELLDDGPGRAAVDVDLDAVPLWEALTGLAERCGVAFGSVDREGRVTLERAAGGAAAPSPRATAGAFLVTVSRVEVNVRRAIDFAGRRPNNVANNAFTNPPCRLYLFAWAEPRTRPLGWFVDAAEPDFGRGGGAAADPAPPGVPPPVMMRGFMGGGRGGVNSPNETQLTLSVPADVLAAADEPRSIPRLTLKARFVLERGERQKVEVPDVLGVKEHVLVVMGFPAVIEDVNHVAGDQYAMRYRIRRNDHSPADWRMLQALLSQFPPTLADAEGKPLPTMGGSSSFSGDEMTATTNYNLRRNAPAGAPGAAGPPAKLVWEYPADVEQVPVTLEFRDLPLP